MIALSALRPVVHRTPHKETSYFANVQALRAVAAIMVLAYHLHAVEGKYFSEHAVPDALGVFGTSGVDLFFVISGFIMAAMSGDKFGNLQNSLEFLRRRTLRIYPIYWFYSLIVLSILLSAPHLVNASSGHQADILTSFTLLPSQTLPLLLQGWTLTYEMFFYLVFAMMIAVSSKQSIGALLAVWAFTTALLAVLFPGARNESATLNVISNPLVFEFIAGCFCALIWRSIPRSASALIFAATIASIILALLISDQTSPEIVIQWRAAYFGIPSFLLVLSAVLAEKRFGVVAPRIMQIIGDASYSIYLSHILIISAVGRIWAIVFPAHTFLWGTLCGFAAATVFGWISFRIIETPLNLTLKKLFARRGNAYAWD